MTRDYTALMKIISTGFLPFRYESPWDLSVLNFQFLSDVASANFFLTKNT